MNMTIRRPWRTDLVFSEPQNVQPMPAMKRNQKRNVVTRLYLVIVGDNKCSMRTEEAGPCCWSHGVRQRRRTPHTVICRRRRLNNDRIMPIEARVWVGPTLITGTGSVMGHLGITSMLRRQVRAPRSHRAPLWSMEWRIRRAQPKPISRR